MAEGGRGAGAALAGLGQLPLVRQLGLMVGLAASIAIGVAVALWARTPSYALLYGGLSEQDTAQVLEVLQREGVPFKVEAGSGAVLVPASKVHQARLRLAAAGLPKGTGVGFELLEKSSSLGTSQFMEAARYQRALEGELARTIASLANVQAARVHLAIPRRTAFLRDRNKPSASVLLRLYPGRTIEPGQVQAIVHLVSSSVPGLEAGRVSVIDQNGRLLSAREDGTGVGLSLRQLEYVQKLEQRYARRIEALLEPIVGPGRVRAQVVAEVDFTRVDKTREAYDPDTPALRSEQVEEDERAAEAGPGGVPGALSNVPPAPGRAAAAPGGQQQAGVQPRSSTRRATRNYELNRTISRVRLPAGRLRRLSVAVVLDHKPAPAAAKGKGKKQDQAAPAGEPYTPEEIARITELVKEAVGYDPRRGDSVHVMSAAFQPPPEPEPLPEPPLWERPWVLDALKALGGAVGLALLVFGVLRPVMRSLAQQAPAPAPAVAGAPALPEGEGGLAPDQVQLSGPQAQGQLPGPPPAVQYEQQVQQARQMVSQDPKVVAQVVKGWVSQDG